MVDDINPALPYGTLSYGIYGILLIMRNAGFTSSTVSFTVFCKIASSSSRLSGSKAHCKAGTCRVRNEFFGYVTIA